MSTSATPGSRNSTAARSPIGYQLTHHFNDQWSVRSVARYANVGTDYAQVYGGGSLAADDRTLDRNTAASKEHFDTVTLEEQVLGHFDTGPVAAQPAGRLELAEPARQLQLPVRAGAVDRHL